MIIRPNIEYWRLIDGYDNYEVSSHGRVRNNQTRIILSLNKHNRGYNTVLLVNNKTKHRFYIHRLVANAFLANEENRPCVDHIDGVKENNHMNNLRWCYYSENKRTKTTSRYNGVSFFKRDKRWRVTIFLNGKTVIIGDYLNEDDAGRAYNTAAKEIFGEFAKLNVID